MQKIETAIGQLEITHPEERDLPQLIALFTSEDLDLRRLQFTSQESYASQGKMATQIRWNEVINALQDGVNGFTSPIIKAIKTQSEGILESKNFPVKGLNVIDPFNLAEVECIDITSLQKSQLGNILTIKNGNEIVSAGRVLPVEASWELVSLVTRKEFRGKGLASILINKMLAAYKQRPLYSFQVISLVPYYMKAYATGHPEIPPYTELPAALQRDLMYMNAFWGPNCIIRINR